MQWKIGQMVLLKTQSPTCTSFKAEHTCSYMYMLEANSGSQEQKEPLYIQCLLTAVCPNECSCILNLTLIGGHNYDCDIVSGIQYTHSVLCIHVYCFKL